MAFCQYKSASGTNCRAYPLKDEPYCFVHHPNKKKEHQQSASRGGRSSSSTLSRLEPIEIDRPADLRDLLVDTICRVRVADKTGAITPQIANCIGFLAGKLNETMRLALMEKKLLDTETWIHRPHPRGDNE